MIPFSPNDDLNSKIVQTELHRHLDVSVRTSTLLELAQERGLEAQSTSLDQFREKMILRKPMSDLSSVLNQFGLFQKVLDRYDVLERVGFEVVEDCYLEGTRLVELRWSPSFVCDMSHLPWEEALDGFEAGIQRALTTYSDMQAGQICIASRDYSIDLVEKTVDFYLKNKTRFVGLDLAGPEAEFPARLFEKQFQLAKKQGARITVHAGEASGPESVWEAIELLGAERIGHGITSIQDPELLKYLTKNRICLEMCPTSNWLTGAFPSHSEHVLPHVLRAGVPVCINTDDPGVFGSSLKDEIEICRNQMGLSEKEIQKTFQHAQEGSFLHPRLPLS